MVSDFGPGRPGLTPGIYHQLSGRSGRRDLSPQGAWMSRIMTVPWPALRLHSET